MEDATLVQPASTHLMLRSMSSDDNFPLAGEMLVGREVECDISLDSGHISRYHSKISVSPNGIFIEDLKSTNGTFVNGKRINTRTRVGVGDEVAFHEISFRLVSEDSGDADATLIGGNIAQAKAPPTPSPSDTNPHFRSNATVEAPALNTTTETAPTPDESGENTQLLSATHLNRLVNRSQKAQKDVKGGSGARLVLMTAPLRGKVFELEDAPVGTTWHIGRDNTSEVWLNDKTISTHHAKLSKVANGFLLVAQEAKNGLIVNGQSADRVFLTHNDKIQMGRMELTFKDDKAQPQATLDESEILNEQIKNTRRLVIGALITLSALAIALAANLL